MGRGLARRAFVVFLSLAILIGGLATPEVGKSPLDGHARALGRDGEPIAGTWKRIEVPKARVVMVAGVLMVHEAGCFLGGEW